MATTAGNAVVESPLPILERIAQNDPSLTEASFKKNVIGRNADLMLALASFLESNTNLKKLNISRNKIKDKGVKYIYHIIATNKSITEFDISFNQFSPVAISKMVPLIAQNTFLHKIRISETNRRTSTLDLFKRSVDTNSSIQSFIDIIDLYTSQNKRIQLCSKTSQEIILSIASRSLKQIPSVVFQATNLQEIDFSENKLAAVPREIYQMINLQNLDLHDNLICTIEPQGITNLQHLRILNLRGNLLTALPFQLTYLPLEQLNICQNLFPSFHSFPYYTLKEKGTRIRASNRLTRVFPRESILFTRLLFIGDDDSDLNKLISLLQGIQIFQGGLKYLSAEQKTVLEASTQPIKTSSGISIFDWFPVADEIPVSTIRNSNQPRKSSDDMDLLPMFAPEDQSFAQSLALPVARHSPRKCNLASTIPNTRPQTARGQRVVSPKQRKRKTVSGGSHTRSPNPKKLSKFKQVSSAQLLKLARTTSATQEKGSRLFRPLQRSSDATLPDNIFQHISCWKLNSRLTHTFPILTCGIQNGQPIIFAFKLHNEFSRIITKILRFIYSLQSNQQETQDLPYIFFIGTYSKTFDRTKLGKQLRAAIYEKFPELQFRLFKVCVSTGRRIKKLNGELIKLIGDATENEIPFPYLPQGWDQKWYSKLRSRIIEFIEHLKTRKEENKEILDAKKHFQVSVLSWASFVDLASKYYIFIDDCEQVSIFLRHIGVIHHFRDVKLPNECESLKNFVFLDPAILFKCYDRMIKEYECSGLPLHPRSALHAAVADGISSVWKFMDIEMQKNIWKLFEHHGLVHKINKGNFIVPSKFEGIPNDIVMNSPPKWNGESSYVGRCYLFTIMNDLCFCKLVSALHLFVTASKVKKSSDELHLVNLYQNMLEFELRAVQDKQNKTKQNPDEDIAVLGACKITYDYEYNRVCLFVCEDDPANTMFCTMAEELEEIFSSDDSFVRAAPKVCAVCVCANCSLLDEPSMLPIEWIEEAASSGKMFHKCGELAVRIDLIAPDVALTNLQHMSVDYSELEIVQKVGDGGFASVFYGIYKEKEIAVKILDKNDSLSESFPEFRKEVLLMAGLQHPNTVGLLGLCMQPFCVLTEFCAFGDLFSYIASRRERKLPLPVDYIMDVLVDIAHGMKFLHTAMPPIIHRDLKSPNILLCRISHDEENLPNSFPTPDFLIEGHKPFAETAKVADFGLSMRTRSAVTERVVDNPIWLAPELLAKQPYSTASDVYAFGIIANELFSLDLPFHDCEYSFMHQLEDKIIAGARPQIPDRVPEELKTLIKECWHQDPTERPTFKEIPSTLERLHLNFPSAKSLFQTLTPVKLTQFNQMATSSRRKRKRGSTLRKFSKDLMDEEELALLLLSHTNQQSCNEN